MFFTVYNKASGAVLSSGTMQDTTDTDEIVLPAGLAFILEAADPAVHVVIDGKLANKDDSTLNELRCANARAKRDSMLREYVDNMNPMRWESFNAADKLAWVTYRQNLLDVTSQAGFPDNVTWPDVPK